jgi:DNA topoisomerase VI subunit B
VLIIMSRVSDKIRQKSAAEFFCEHQQIAGFDNAGKSLFTSIRELVENSLDATEIIHKLPNISVKIIEYNEQEHNKLHGIKQKEKKVEKTEDLGESTPAGTDAGFAETSTIVEGGTSDAPGAATTPAKTPKGKEKVVKDAARMYYKIVVQDNGCGMASKDIGNLLGRVLSGSKHGIKQTRGKFGLGAKMALIWSKKSSGLPIEITSAEYVVGRSQGE